MRNLVSCPWSDAFGAGGRAWLAEIELPPDEREQVDRTLRLLEGLDAEIRTAEAGIATAVVDDRRVHHLLSIPGVGIQTAVGLLALVGNIGSLSKAEQARQLPRARPAGPPVGRPPGLDRPIRVQTRSKRASGVARAAWPGTGVHENRASCAGETGVGERARHHVGQDACQLAPPRPL
jgi:hypothetical protein